MNYENRFLDTYGAIPLNEKKILNIEEDFQSYLNQCGPVFFLKHEKQYASTV